MDSWNDGVRGIEIPQLINSGDEFLVVEAGPGAGKTFGLVRRVERILHRDGLAIPAEDVLVVAFNRVIAKSLATDIEKRLKEIGYSGRLPVIRTVHALCLEAIGEEFRLLLQLEREAMVYDLLEQFPTLRDSYDYGSAIQALADHEAGHAIHMDLWQASQRWLVRHRAQLLSELPDLLLSHLKTGDVGTKTYRHVLVDEFQDLTPGEQELFKRLVATDGNLVTLGDPRQSIYAFRGNDREGLTKVARELVVEPLVLEECQRCPVSIVQAANQLMALYPSKPMKSTSTEAGEITVLHWGTPAAEAKGMAKGILANVRAYPADHHLVMTTRRQLGLLLRNELAALSGDEIEIELNLSEGILEQWPVKEAFLLLGLLFDPDPATWRAWFAYDNSTTEKTILPPQRNAAAYLAFLAECRDAISYDSVLDLAVRSTVRDLGAGATTIQRRAVRYGELASSIDRSLSDEELISNLLSDDRWVTQGVTDKEAVLLDLAILREQFLSILDDLTGEDRLRAAVKRLRYAIGTREPFQKTEDGEESKRPVVQISTLWGAKGVTTDHAYVVGLCREAIPGTRRAEYPGTDDDHREEQRRLFYVTITRTKKQLILSRPTKIRSGDARRLGLPVQTSGRWPELRASGFLSDIRRFLPDSIEGDDWLIRLGA